LISQPHTNYLMVATDITHSVYRLACICSRSTQIDHQIL
jgi:hypothetical protein